MAHQCVHHFEMKKTDNTLVQFTCALCHSGQHMWIMECKHCKLKVCRACTQSSQATNGPYNY